MWRTAGLVLLLCVIVLGLRLPAQAAQPPPEQRTAEEDGGSTNAPSTTGSLPLEGSEELKRTNEIKTAIPLLDAIDFEGKEITADALLTQRDIAEYLVRQRHAHYHFSVKNNQPGHLQRLFLADCFLWHSGHSAKIDMPSPSLLFKIFGYGLNDKLFPGNILPHRPEFCLFVKVIREFDNVLTHVITPFLLALYAL